MTVTLNTAVAGGAAGSGSVDAASVLTALEDMDTGQETSARAAILAIDADGARSAVLLDPVTLSANTNLTRADHGNRTIYVDTAGLTLTINNDATGLWESDDFIQIKALGSGTATLVQGTATLTTGTGAAAATASAVGRQVQAQWISANNWETVSAASSGGGGSVATDTIWDAAGDLVYGTGANTATRLAPGAAGQVARLDAAATAFIHTYTPRIIPCTSPTSVAAGGGTATLGTFTIPGGALGLNGLIHIRALIQRTENAGTNTSFAAYCSASTFDTTTGLVNAGGSPPGLLMTSGNGYYLLDWPVISGNGTNQTALYRLIKDISSGVGATAYAASAAIGAASTSVTHSSDWTITLRGTAGASDGCRVVWAFLQISNWG